MTFPTMLRPDGTEIQARRPLMQIAGDDDDVRMPNCLQRAAQSKAGKVIENKITKCAAGLTTLLGLALGLGQEHAVGMDMTSSEIHGFKFAIAGATLWAFSSLVSVIGRCPRENFTTLASEALSYGFFGTCLLPVQGVEEIRESCRQRHVDSPLIDMDIV